MVLVHYFINKMIISIDAEKVNDKTQQGLMIKILNKLGIGRQLLNLINCIYKKSITSIILNGERLSAFPLN